MNVILLDRLHNVGNIGETVKVKPGFARNFLIPNGKAVPANAKNMAEFEAHREELEKAAAASLKAGQERAEAFKEKVITITARASEEGNLYGSLGTADIAEAITASGNPVVKSEVILPYGPLRQVGEFEISVQLHTDINVPVKVIVVAEG